MKSSRTKFFLAAVAVLAMLTVAAVPLESDDSSAVTTDIPGTQIKYYYDATESLTVSAGGTTTLTFFLYSEYSEDVKIRASVFCNESKITAKSDTNYISLAHGGEAQIDITVSAGEYAHQGTYALEVTITANSVNIDGDEGSFPINIKVTSNLTSDKYNKFLGLFPNEFDGILGNVWFTAIVSFLALLAIGYAIVIVVVPVCARLITKKDDPERNAIKKTLYQLCHAIIIIWAFGEVLRILGTDESLIDIANRVFSITYAIVGVIIGWHLYKVIVDIILRHMSEKAELHKEELQSLRPLFMYIGEIAIAVVAVIVVMNFLGFDLAAIITSAGIVSLGISMGAQDVLKQFFAGLVILATRPFKKGDLIRIGSDSTIYKVRKVNVMNTELENWDNTDVNIMPNSTIETSKIQNITGETLVTKVYLTMDVAYGQDINKARQIMQDVACSNPHVITDGSYGRPYTRVENLGNTNITIKMGMYFDDINTSYTARGHIRQAMVEAFMANGIQFYYDRITIDEVRVTEAEAKNDKGSNEYNKRNTES